MVWAALAQRGRELLKVGISVPPGTSVEYTEPQVSPCVQASILHVLEKKKTYIIGPLLSAWSDGGFHGQMATRLIRQSNLVLCCGVRVLTTMHAILGSS